MNDNPVAGQPSSDKSGSGRCRERDVCIDIVVPSAAHRVYREHSSRDAGRSVAVAVAGMNDSWPLHAFRHALLAYRTVPEQESVRADNAIVVQ